MGNFKIEIEAVGGHGVLRETAQGDVIEYYRTAQNEPDTLAKRFVEEFAKTNNVVFAKLTHWPDSTPIIDNLLTGKREHGDFMQGWPGDRMLAQFNVAMTPFDVGKRDVVAEVTRPYRQFAYDIVRRLPAGAERTVALRKLLESMDAALRAALIPA